MCKDTTVLTCHIGSFNPYISLLLIDLPFSPMMLTILRSESIIIDTYWVNPNLLERCCICATELRFSCSSFKNSILRYRCWIKGQIALLRKPGEGSLMFQRANSSLPRFSWRLYREKEKGLHAGATSLLFSEIIISITQFQVAVMSHLWLKLYMSQKPLVS